MGSLRVGTSGWSYQDWVPAFYSAGTPQRDFLQKYAEHYDVVEVDASYYRIPSRQMVEGWFNRTPHHFQFAVKAPGKITHENVLVDGHADWEHFLANLAPLGHKLHSILLQFQYFNKKTIPTADEFFDRLDAFFQHERSPWPCAVEIRNKQWLLPKFFQLLRGHNLAYALTEHVWMPPIEKVIQQHDCITGPFAYVRLIGDRYGIEKITTVWDKPVVDRADRIRAIVKALAGIIPATDVVTFINNHYAGHAPASCQEFLRAMADARTDP